MSTHSGQARIAWRAKEATYTSLDTVISDTDGITVQETLADLSADVEAEALEAVTQEERQELWRAVGDLRPLERVAVSLNLGLVRFDGATVGDVEKAACNARQKRVRDRLAKFFREGRRSAQRLGFLPEDATGRRPRGSRIVVTLSGHRGR